MDPDKLIKQVVEKYLSSGEFNGLPAYAVISDSGIDRPSLLTLLRPLIESNTLSINFGDYHPNPHIRAFSDPFLADQLKRLDTFDGNNFVLYPARALLLDLVNPKDYEGKPFTLRLALGAPQLEYEAFDLAVVDHYRRDPRYHFWTNDIGASLSIGDEAYESESFPDKHKVLIQQFGFSFDSNLRRAATVSLIDLSRLTPEHQQIWDANRAEGEFKLHPDFYKAAILGEWGLKVSLREAMAEEIKTINAMCKAIGWANLFRKEYEDFPKEIAFLIRPTAEEYCAFVQTLDKLLSDNINVGFFPGEISREIDSVRDDGKIEVRTRGTIQLLEEWFEKYYTTEDTAPLEQCLATLRDVRKQRSKPAHTVVPENYNEELFEDQRLLFVQSYEALRTIRLALQDHPKAGTVAESMNPQVRDGDIWFQ